jgi:hypothetical protein
MCTTDEVSGLIDDVQYALGEGPCVDGYHQDRVVLEPDLADPRTIRSSAFAVERCRNLMLCDSWRQ